MEEEYEIKLSLASLSHYLMGFDPDHRYHHYTLF